ncbi:MAG: ATP-binding cassette domain-containing protein, partial [Alphaproteobacteria bacterium]|nr:ATP-binding cassette domain-containing protein [Alphaproteobacteria bacterium]
SGKSTFIRCLNKLILPSNGDILINNKSYNNLTRQHICSNVATIFQNFNLVPRLSVLSNVLIGRLSYLKGIRRVLGIFSENDKEHALQALEKIGIINYAFKNVKSLSGGQQQRVAIARAVSGEPQILLADEPIANLDPKNAIMVLELLRDLNKKNNVTIIVNLHQIELANKYFDRVIGFREGSIVHDSKVHGEFSNKHYEEIYKDEE